MIGAVESALKSKIFWVTAILVVLYLYLKKVVYSYWERRGVPHKKPTVPFGNVTKDLLLKKQTLGNYFKQSYEKFHHCPYHGIYIFHSPILMINDPELIKQILVKEFTNFCDRGLYFNEKIDPLNGHLFFVSGNKWRTLRAKLSPTFTAGKLKHMFPLVTEISNEMKKVCDESLTMSEVEFKDLIARYTTDTIFSLAFGFNSNTLRHPDSECRVYGNKSIENDPLRNTLAFFAPQVLDTFSISVSQPKVAAFFTKLFKEMVEKRREEKGNRKDFLNVLIDLMDHEQIIEKDDPEKTGKKLEMIEAAAQAFVFFIAGFETSSSIATHGLYELAMNPECQEKLHEEIDQVLQSPGGMNYESLLQMEYLDMCFLETMRKHPSVPFLNRICINDCKISNSDLYVEKGTRIAISVSGLHRNPNIYPEPDKFDPTRFSKENVEARHPYAYLPFGEGPRICIGKRLGIIQSKIALFAVLSNYNISVCEKTPIPCQYSLDSLLQTPRDGMYLKVEKRKIN